MIRKIALLAVCLLLCCSSSSDPSIPAAESATLRPGIVAKVGVLEIAAVSVAKAAARANTAPKIALDREIADALFASAALRNGENETLAFQAAARARLARVVLERLYDEEKKTDPSDAEIAAATAAHFVDLDRPEAFRVIHAVVKLPYKADAAVTSRARSLAGRLAEQVARATDEQDFRSRAEALADRGGLEMTVETLKPVTADGRIADPNHPTKEIETYVPAFAQAASRLTEPGQKSAIVTTEFGFHVLMLLDRTPPKTVPFDERKRLLRAEIVTGRAAKRKAELLARLAAATPSSIERSAESLLATVGVGHETP